jgi:DnaD/phage-associated family protein
MFNLATGGILDSLAVVAQRYINDCNGLQLKVLLLFVESNDIGPDDLATRLGVAKELVLAALGFWVDRGILIQHNSAEPESSAATASRSFNVKLTAKEAAEIVSQSEGLSFVLAQIPKLLNRMATRFDVSNLVSMHCDLGMEPELIMLLFEHCGSVGKVSPASVRKEANSWVAQNINSYERAEDYIAKHNELADWYKAVGAKFGFPTLDSQQQITLGRWKTEFKFDLATIEKAIAAAIQQKGKGNVNISYVNGILRNWDAADRNKAKLLERNEFSSFNPADL